MLAYLSVALPSVFTDSPRRRLVKLLTRVRGLPAADRGLSVPDSPIM